MKSSNRQKFMGELFRLVAISVLLICWGISTREVTAKEQSAENDLHTRFIQGNGFAWEGEWRLHSDLTDLSANRMYISRGSGGYTIEFLPPVTQSDADWHPPLVRQERASVGESGIQYIAENSYQGVVFARVTIHFERTENPDQLRGSLAFVSEHQFSGNDESWTVVDNYISTEATALCAVRNNAEFPSPCMATGAGFVPAEPASQPQAAPTEQAAPAPEIPNPQVELPQNQDAGPPPEVGVPPSTDTSMDWNMVSPAGQAAAAAATTALLALWLVLESQGSQSASSSSNNLVDTILEETNTYSPAEAGHSLAANTADILDQLNRPPTAPPPAPVPPPAASAEPDTSYFGPPGHPVVEVFDGRDAYNILHALQLIPQDIPPDGQFQFNRADLDRFLNGHPDGVPHQVRLPNGNVVVVGQVQGITFEDRGDDASNHSTVDFTRGVAIAVNVIKPDASLSEEDLAAATSAQTGQQGGARPQVQESSGGVGEPHPGSPSDTGGNEANATGGETEVTTAGNEPPGESTGALETGEPLAEEAGTGEITQTRTAEEDEAELDRFFGNAEESGTQGQRSGGNTPAGDGSRGQGGGTYGGGPQGSGIDGSSSGGGSRLNSQVDTGSGDVELEEADEGNLIGDEYVEDVKEREDLPESEGEIPATGRGDEELNARIDALMDEIKAGMKDQAEPPDSAGGGESGVSQAGMIDGEEAGSATGDL